MLIKIRAVALRTVPHNDKASILTVWSAEKGRLALLLSAGNTAESRRRRALTMPMSLFEGVVNLRHDSNINRLHEIKAWSPDGFSADVSFHPIRSTVALFLSEVLNVVTREEDADPALWKLITETVPVIARGDSGVLANLPVSFLVRVAQVLGIAPDMERVKKGLYFDMVEGVFRNTLPTHNFALSAAETKLMLLMAHASHGYDKLGHIKLNRKERALFLEKAIQYFTLHHYPVNKLKSLEILRTVFD
ncbi:MAG: DNA repair protein RecO C-terminal domain-containing protein [Muribaculaceae bacterium]|nr:DNA repair protein RecO C-terminal domain-containing protein [Muribaculaceae bacterium]